MRRLASLVAFLAIVLSLEGADGNLPPLAAAIESKTDVWGEAAMRQTNGASYEFFENLLPPPRYVHADFRYYPIVLSAPSSRVKARLISDGSGLNLQGGARSWNVVGTQVMFRVGPDEFKFGGIANRLEYPTLLDGYLPIPIIRYSHASEKYALEAFAVTLPDFETNGAVCVRFSLESGDNGIVTIQPLQSPVLFTNQHVLDEKGNVLVMLGGNWTWERQRAHARISKTNDAVAVIWTKPLTGWGPETPPPIFDGREYAKMRWFCSAAWKELLSRGMNVETPEPLVNHAWKNLIIQNFSLINGDRMNYSAGNQYEKMYAAESSDAALPLMWWGYEQDMKRLFPVILDIQDKRLPHHFASHKLNDICRYYWQTRDAEFVNAMRPRWQKDLDLLLDDRIPEYGLMKENYCTDIEVPVYPLTANSTSWAALRDMVPVLEELGDKELAGRVKESGADLKKAILAAVDKNQRNVTDPPFIPMALFHNEDTHEPITNSRLGSYWDLVVNYVIGSRLFVGSERELWLPRYVEQHGGLFMGLTRSAATNNTFWTGTHRTNPLYGMRYILDTLRRDDPERALVSFYGMLAQGMTRNTFIGAEGCAIEPLDEGGRFFYCPPNSSSNGQWLAVLRYLLVQDWDMDEDGRPDTLRLLFGTPRRWLEDGKTITVEHAPTAFGKVSMKVESRLRQEEVTVDVSLPARNKPMKTLLRARVPEGWKVVSAKCGERSFVTDEKGTIEITGLEGTTRVVFKVKGVP
jgi:hypothetical protein